MPPATASRLGQQHGADQSILIAQDVAWAGPYFEHPGRLCYLFRSAAGEYFVLHQTAWQLEHDWLEPVSRPEAVRLYHEMSIHEKGFDEAFPEVEADATWPLEGVASIAQLPAGGEPHPR